MNVEMFFVRTGERATLVDLISKRLHADPDEPGQQPDWGLESSYDVLLAPQKKRAVAVSPVHSGWIAAIESKEVLDFALLETISRILRVEVLAIQLSDVAGVCAHAHCVGGILQSSHVSEEENDLLGVLRRFLAGFGVPFDLLVFSEAVQLRERGWVVVR